jgi:hypothetical protein
MLIRTSEQATVGVLYPRYHGSSVTAHKSGYSRFLTAANGRGTIYYVPNTVLPLPVKEEGPPSVYPL